MISGKNCKRTCTYCQSNRLHNRQLREAIADEKINEYYIESQPDENEEQAFLEKRLLDNESMNIIDINQRFSEYEDL